MYHQKLTEDEIKELLLFMYEAHLNTYAADRETNQKYQLFPPKNPGHIEFLYENGIWTYHDSYYGEKNAPGKEVIYHNGEPVWTMAYRSNLYTDDFEIVSKIYDFLREALRNNPPEMPFRGPKEYEKDGFSYSFVMQEGDLKNFIGKEEIYYNGQLVYSNRTLGGVTDE